MQEETYQFKNLILSDKYLDEPSKLAAVIGVNDNGEPILFDFAKNPHLFIGGDQGCGKSTLIHSIIMSLMQRNTPEEFQFVYFDPKGLDVNLYKQSKFLFFNNKNIVASFDFLLQECNSRGRFLSENNRKTVASYNEFAALCDIPPIPELFVIIDDVSYLLEENKIKQHIEELNNYGRAVGIHLIIADTNPTLGIVLKIAKLIPNKVVFRFTYADYRALLERKNVVPLSDDGEILCDFRGTEYVHGHSCFVAEDEIKTEVAKNIVEIKEEKQIEEVAEESEEETIYINTEETKEYRYNTIADVQNGMCINLDECPEFAKLLKKLEIVDMEAVTEPQEVIITNHNQIEQIADLIGINPYIVEFLNRITITVYPKGYNSDANEETKPEFFQDPESYNEEKSKFDSVLQFVSQNKNFIIYGIIAFVIMIMIYFVLNIPKEAIDKITPYIIRYGFFPSIIILCVWISKRKKGGKGGRCSIYAIDNISDGHDFEYVVADLLKNVGFYNVKVTVGSGDYGIDVIGWYDGASYAIQCKKYSSKVGVSAVQEAFAGRSYYGCNYAMVITNNYFTPAAIKLAEATGVILWDRNNVKKLINGRI